MYRIVLPIFLVIAGSGIGAGIGLTSRGPETAESAMAPSASEREPSVADIADSERAKRDTRQREYVKLNNQFIVPVVKDEKVKALVVMALSVEVSPGQKETIYAQEPRLRDSLLQVLFDHANFGGFDGEFTRAGTLNVLRKALREAAQKNLGKIVTDVLIIDISRQDI